MNRLQKIIPKYAVVPALLYLLCIPSYFLVRLITGGMEHLHVVSTIDDLVPFVPAFIWIYVLAYFQWLFGHLAIAHYDERLFKQHMGAEIIGKLTCVLIFILLPTTIVRPEVTESGLTYDLVRFIYAADNPPDNLFPSIHCMESWIVTCGLFKTNAPKPLKMFMLIFTCLVFASVVLVKQHFIIDIPAGIFVASIAILLSDKLHFSAIYDSIEKIIFRRES